MVSCTKEYLETIKDGTRRHTRSLDYQVRPASKFADGRVEIANIQADLDPLRNASAAERTSPRAVRFRYKAKVVADRNVSDSFALLTYVTEGSIGTHLIPIGRLSAGSAKEIETTLHSQVGAVGSLHVVSDGMDIASNQHPEPYDIRAYYDTLVKDVKGISAAALLKAEDIFPHVLSDDGRYLASLRKHDGKKFMIVYDLEAMKLLCETPVAAADDYAADLTWVSDHEVAYVADGTFDDKRDEISLFVLDATTGKTTESRSDIYDIIAQLPDKPHVLVVHQFRSNQGSVFYKYDLRTKKDFDLEDPAAAAYYFDRGGAARVQVRYDGGARIYSLRPTPDSRWRDADDLVKQPGLRFNVRGNELLDRVVDVHSVGPDGDTLYISSRLGSDRFELCAFSMSQGVIKQVIAKHPTYDLDVEDGNIARLLFAKNSPQLLGMIYEGQKPRVVWLEPKFAAMQKSLDTTFPDHLNYPIDWAKNGSTFIYWSTSDRDPGTFYAVKPGQGLIPLLQLSENLTGKTLVETTPMEFTARDGTKLPGYVTRPGEREPGGAPLLVAIHGGPMARDSWRFSADNQFFASRGYMVLQVNYRGSSGYGAAFQKAGLHARLDTVVIDDIADCVKALIASGEVDPHRIGVMGASFGGWATYMSLIKYPELYRAGIAIAAVASWRKSIDYDRWKFSKELGYRFWRTLLDRRDFAAEEPFIDAYRRAAEIKQPVFIMHGERDDVVKVAQAQLMLDALKRTNANVQSRAFPLASHTYWPFADRVVMLNESALFLDRHLAKAP